MACTGPGPGLTHLLAQTILDDTAEYGQDEEGYEEEEYVYEAEWGAGREGAIDDEEDNTMD